MPIDTQQSIVIEDVKIPVVLNGNFELSSTVVQKQLDFVAGTMSCSYSEPSKTTLPYYLIQPKETNNNESLPLIIWLHGSGEVGANQSTYKSVSMPKYLLNLNERCPNAYVLCPQLAGPFHPGRWNNDVAAQHIDDIIDGFVSTHNVDTNRIYIIGHSLGGQGALYVASKLDKFAACITLSPYNPGCDLSTLPTKTISIAGNTKKGEDSASVAYANSLKSTIGETNVVFIETNHGKLPEMLLSIDDDNNKCSDFLEWLFTIMKEN